MVRIAPRADRVDAPLRPVVVNRTPEVKGLREEGFALARGLVHGCPTPCAWAEHPGSRNMR